MTPSFHQILQLDMSRYTQDGFSPPSQWHEKMRNFLRKWESYPHNTFIAAVSRRVESYLCGMRPFPPFLRMTLGGSALSDSSLARSMGPHNTLSITDEMETVWKLSEISCHHKCAGGVLLRCILLLHEDLLMTTAPCPVTDLQRTNCFAATVWVMVQQGGRQGSIQY